MHVRDNSSPELPSGIISKQEPNEYSFQFCKFHMFEDFDNYGKTIGKPEENHRKVVGCRGGSQNVEGDSLTFGELILDASLP